MERIIYIPFLIVILVGLIMMSFAESTENHASIVYELNGVTDPDFTSGKEYMVRIKMEEGKSLDSDVLAKGFFWDVKGPEGISLHAYQLAPLFTFTEIGRYIIDTYQPNGLLIAKIGRASCRERV